MNKQSKGFSIIFFLIWPLSALLIGIKSFNSKFGRNLLIALYAFLGFTAISIGDLERYEEEYYSHQGTTIGDLFIELISLQTGKFYNSFISIVCSLVLESHHFYFLFLFLIYGYFYINAINLFTDNSYLKLDKRGLFFFFGVLLFLLLRPLPNIAFYTGGMFIVYNMVSYYKTDNKRFLYLLFFAPLMHIGLSIYLLLPLILVLFKNRTAYYVIFVMLTFSAGKTNVVSAFGALSESNSGTIIQSKFDDYASEDGQARLKEYYSDLANKRNGNLKIFSILQDAIWYWLVPIGVLLLFIKREILLIDDKLKKFFNIVLLFWGIANLMMNISQGVRFYVLFSFISIGFIFTVSNQTISKSNKLFNAYLYFFIPLLFLYGIMGAYATNILFRIQFFISNFFIEFFNYVI